MIEEMNLKLVILHELGILDLLREKMHENTMPNLARFLTVMCDTNPTIWRDIMKKLKNLNLHNEQDLLTELNLNKAHEIISLFGIKLEKE
jgi:hypothetical protein